MNKHFYLISETVRNNVLDAVRDCLLDGKTKVTLSSAGSKSAKQRALQHVWYRDVVKSGIGGIDEESEKGVDIKSKRDFGMIIVFRNPEKYQEFLSLHDLAIYKHHKDSDFMKYFYHEHFHTEWFDTTEMAEFLTHFEIYYSKLGVNLSDPIDWKLLNR